ncbi:MAG: HAD family phosphatase [Xanthomonadaceae bacterium]|nr:HAD family phosphatase [Xanthomonadaceae bacterium]
MSKPLNLSQASSQVLKSIRGVCLDIDDTFSSRGKITDQAYSALWKLKSAGFVIVPITGRPAGWCDHIARFWPVDAVVGENGAFTFFMDGGVRRRLNTPMGRGVIAMSAKKKLKSLESKILKKFPKAKWASDQSYREFDLAIDICEDVAPWKDKDVEALLTLCEKAGAHAKLSSVHVNVWFGEYNKFSGMTHWLNKGAPGVKGSVPKISEWIYIGDSPNDEPLFEKFPNTVGVANLKPYLSKLKYPPRWITSSESGAGFTEMAERLIKC